MCIYTSVCWRATSPVSSYIAHLLSLIMIRHFTTSFTSSIWLHHFTICRGEIAQTWRCFPEIPTKQPQIKSEPSKIQLKINWNITHRLVKLNDIAIKIKQELGNNRESGSFCQSGMIWHDILTPRPPHRLRREIHLTIVRWVLVKIVIRHIDWHIKLLLPANERISLASTRSPFANRNFVSRSRVMRPFICHLIVFYGQRTGLWYKWDDRRIHPSRWTSTGTRPL